jgi:hypothetical protein
MMIGDDGSCSQGWSLGVKWVRMSFHKYTTPRMLLVRNAPRLNIVCARSGIANVHASVQNLHVNTYVLIASLVL